VGSWLINCNTCGRITDPGTIEVLANHCDEAGWLICLTCKSRGYIRKRYVLQEGRTWEIYLWRIWGGVRTQDKPPFETYFPFAFLISESPEGPPDQVWFCYYKDTRPEGGTLQMNRGPVLDFDQVRDLARSFL